MPKTIVIMLDAFRKDYINKEDTPFLESFTKKFKVGELEQPFGFKGTVGFFTGKHPKKINQFVYYGYDKKEKKMPSSLNSILRIFPKKLSFYTINFLNHLVGKDIFLPSIKVKYLKYFTTKQKKHFYQKNSVQVETIFDSFRKNKINYLFYDFPLIIKNNKPTLHKTLKNNDLIRTKKSLQLCKNKEYDFYYIHLCDLDSVGHHCSPESKEIKQILRKQDKYVEKILSNFDLEKDNILLWSDHGMLQVKQSFDLESKLPKFGDGYIYFLDSTMARFWFFNKNKKAQVLSILKQAENQKKGKLLSDKQKQKLKIDFKHNFYGDEIFLLNPGILLYPNFFNEYPMKGMHGYDLSNKKELAFFSINKLCKNKAKTEDLFPTLLKLMNLSIPRSIEGRLLLESS